MKTIKLSLLVSMSACLAHRRCFAEMFGEEVEVNKKNFRDASSAGLDFEWFVSAMFSRISKPENIRDAVRNAYYKFKAYVSNIRNEESILQEQRRNAYYAMAKITEEQFADNMSKSAAIYESCIDKIADAFIEFCASIPDSDIIVSGIPESATSDTLLSQESAT